MQALQKIGVPYTAQEIADAPEAVRNRTEMEALIAYMQGLKFYGEPKAADGSAQNIVMRRQ
jgi:cytochrome c oxidase cbb3-type subunit 2